MDDKKEEIKNKIIESISVKIGFLEEVGNIEKVVDVIVNCFKQGGKLLICGNGGSAADAQHIAGELVDRFLMERQGLPAIALTSDSSVLTAWANDKDFNDVFRRQVEALGKEGDVLLGISTSGGSENIIRAFDEARKRGMKVVSLTGKDGGKMKSLSDECINVNSESTPRIQESHMVAYHIVCELVERERWQGLGR